MNEVMESWRGAITQWASAHPLRVDAVMAGAAAVAALWLLVTLVRMMLPKRKFEAPASSQADVVEKRGEPDIFKSEKKRSAAAKPSAPEPAPAPPAAEKPSVVIDEPELVSRETADISAPSEEYTAPSPAAADVVDDFMADEEPDIEIDTSWVGDQPLSDEAVAQIDAMLEAEIFEESDGLSLEEDDLDDLPALPPHDAPPSIDAPLSKLDPYGSTISETPANDPFEADDDDAFDNALDALKRQDASNAPGGASEPPPPIAPPSYVDVSVFTPQRVQPDQAFILQTIFHVDDQADDVASIAAAIDPQAQRRVTKTLRQAVQQGQIITASLDIPSATIDQPVQAFVWRGDIEPLQFIVTVPAQEEAVSTLAKLQVALDGVPVASAVWRIVLTPDADVANEDGAYVPLQRYRRAFVSYSSQDRVEVLKRVQGLQAAGLEVFQDVLDLAPGDRWANELYRHIDDADAFYLFWSESSAKSEWVAKEWRYALERSATHPDRRPDICPVILTAPPPTPPQELSDRHFNDILAYVLKAHESAARS